VDHAGLHLFEVVRLLADVSGLLDPDMPPLQQTKKFACHSASPLSALLAQKGRIVAHSPEVQVRRSETQCRNAIAQNSLCTRLASFELGLLHGAQVMVKPVQSFLDDFVSRHDMSGVKQDMTLVFGRRA
jgi:hypothetical protein